MGAHRPRPDRPALGEFETIPGQVGALSSGERALLLIAGGPAVDLSETLPALSREHAALVLAAVAHATGSHEHTDVVINPDGRPTGFTRPDALYPWP